MKENNSNNDNYTGKRQLVGNAGLYYVCYELSKRGWNVMPTSRNARGIDVIIYDQKGKEMHTIQVKSLSDEDPVPFNNTLNTLLMSEYLFIVNNINENPNIFIMPSKKAKSLATPRIDKKGKKSYWLTKKEYEKYKDNWGSFEHKKDIK